MVVGSLLASEKDRGTGPNVRPKIGRGLLSDPIGVRKWRGEASKSAICPSHDRLSR